MDELMFRPIEIEYSKEALAFLEFLSVNEAEKLQIRIRSTLSGKAGLLKKLNPDRFYRTDLRRNDRNYSLKFHIENCSDVILVVIDSMEFLSLKRYRFIYSDPINLDEHIESLKISLLPKVRPGMSETVHFAHTCENFFEKNSQRTDKQTWQDLLSVAVRTRPYKKTGSGYGKTLLLDEEIYSIFYLKNEKASVVRDISLYTERFTRMQMDASTFFYASRVKKILESLDPTQLEVLFKGLKELAQKQDGIHGDLIDQFRVYYQSSNGNLFLMDVEAL